MSARWKRAAGSLVADRRLARLARMVRAAARDDRDWRRRLERWREIVYPEAPAFGWRVTQRIGYYGMPKAVRIRWQKPVDVYERSSGLGAWMAAPTKKNAAKLRFSDIAQIADLVKRKT